MRGGSSGQVGWHLGGKVLPAIAASPVRPDRLALDVAAQRDPGMLAIEAKAGKCCDDFRPAIDAFVDAPIDYRQSAIVTVHA